MLHKARVVLAFVLLPWLVPMSALAAPATCTVVAGGLVHGITASAAGALSWTIDQADHVVFPMDVAADGSFTMTTSDLHRTDGSAAVIDASDPVATRCVTGKPQLVDTFEYVTAPGPEAFMHLGVGGPSTGRIGGDGTVVVDSFPVELATLYTAPDCTILELAPSLTTGAQVNVTSGTQSITEGKKLDFATGRFTVSGFAVLQNAPGSSGGLLNILTLTCTLSPVPSAAPLPPATTPLTLTSARATFTARGPLAETKTKKPDKGDVLKLKAHLVPGTTPLDFATQDLFLHVTQVDGPMADLVQLRVRAGDLKGKGKRLSAHDKDGSVVTVVKGHKTSESGSVKSVEAGTLTLMTGKKGIDLTLREQGLSLDGLSGQLRVTVAVGTTEVASVDVTVKGTAKKRSFR
jgi:hypothetical protein